ncbi:unnamed protein product [Pedinophyceae sp. YPF-701]|nr:unnamed protein product [Pedinophyceae sp. YPF-701]
MVQGARGGSRDEEVYRPRVPTRKQRLIEPPPKPDGTPYDVEYVSFITPWKRPTEVEELVQNTVYTFSQPWGFGPLKVGLRMTVYRLPSGGLWLHSPVAPTEECLAHVRAIGGPVEHLVVPGVSPEHSVFLPGWLELYPDAKMWVPQELFKFPLRTPKVDELLKPGLTGVLGRPSLAAWEGAVDMAVLRAPNAFEEGAFLLKEPKILLTSDLMVATSPEYTRAMEQLLGPIARAMIGEYGLRPLVAPMLGLAYPRVVGAWAERISRWDFETVVSCHMDAPTLDGRAAFEKAFGDTIRKYRELQLTAPTEFKEPGRLPQRSSGGAGDREVLWERRVSVPKAAQRANIRATSHQLERELARRKTQGGQRRRRPL